jgi:poly-beta-1,6-N-acetyl-D-glucosamine synthase
MIWLLILPVFIYFIIILEIFRNLLKIKPYTYTEVSSVKVSVLIACRDEKDNLPNLLKSLYSQDYNKDLFEVIIIDDNSTDNTYSLASSYNQIRNFKVLHNPGSGKKSAVGAGVKAASGELIITTDADCSHGQGWISAIAGFYSKTRSDMIICPVQLEEKPGFIGRFMELEFLSLQGITAGTAEAGMAVMCNGANLAFTKEAYNRHSEKLHNEILSGEDVFLLHSLKKEPHSKIGWLNSQDAIVNTRQPDSLKSFFIQRSRWISKAKAFHDMHTILISIVTFVTIMVIISLLVAGIVNREFLLLFLVSIILKSIPDFLILRNTTGRYGKKHLMRWFIPSQLVYPFYVIIVACCSLFMRSRWK